MMYEILTYPQARDNKLTIEDMAGGTFTISNVSHLSSLIVNIMC